MATNSTGLLNSDIEDKYAPLRYALLKQLGITRIINILHSKGPMPLVLLGSLFAIRASKEEREVIGIGWKLQDMLDTLRGFPSMITITTTGASHNVGLNQNLLHHGGEKMTDNTLALATGFLKMRDSLLEQPSCRTSQLFCLLSSGERLVWGKSFADFTATLKSFPDLFQFEGDEVSLKCSMKSWLPSEFIAQPMAILYPKVFQLDAYLPAHCSGKKIVKEEPQSAVTGNLFSYSNGSNNNQMGENTRNADVDSHKGNRKTDSIYDTALQGVISSHIHSSGSLGLTSSPRISSKSSSRSMTSCVKHVKTDYECDDSCDDDVFEPPASGVFPAGTTTGSMVKYSFRDSFKREWSSTPAVGDDKTLATRFGHEFAPRKIKVEPINVDDHLGADRDVSKPNPEAFIELQDHKPTMTSCNDDNKRVSCNKFASDDNSLDVYKGSIKIEQTDRIAPAMSIKLEAGNKLDGETIGTKPSTLLDRKARGSPMNDPQTIVARVQDCLISHGARTVRYVCDTLTNHHLIEGLKMDSVRQLLVKHSTLFHIHHKASTYSGSDDLLVCLQTQKDHLQNAIDVLVAYLIEKQGLCKMHDVHFVVSVMSDEAARVAASTPGHWLETVAASAGNEYLIEGDEIVLRDYSKWRQLLALCSNRVGNTQSGSPEGEFEQEESKESLRTITTLDIATGTCPSVLVHVEDVRNTNDCDEDAKGGSREVEQQQRNDTDDFISLDVSMAFSESSGDESESSTEKWSYGKVAPDLPPHRSTTHESYSGKSQGDTPNPRSPHLNPSSPVSCHGKGSSHRKETKHNGTKKGKSAPKYSAYDWGFNTMKNEMEVKGVRSIGNLLNALKFSSSDVWKAIGRTAEQVKKTIARESKHNFKLIEPPYFSSGPFSTRQIIVCLPEQWSLFWQCMAYIKNHVLHIMPDRCRPTDAVCKDLLRRMPRDMAKLFNHTSTQLRLSIFAASNRPQYFKITRGCRQYWIEIDSKTDSVGLSDLSNQLENLPRKLHLTYRSFQRQNSHDNGHRSSYRSSKSENGKSHSTQGSSFASPLSTLPAPNAKDRRPCHTRPKTTGKSKKRKLAEVEDSVENVPGKETKITCQQNDTNPFLLSALKTLKTYLERKGPRTCEQLHSYINSDPYKRREQRAIGNHKCLLEILKAQGSFRIRDTPDNSKHSMVCLVQSLDGNHKNDTSSAIDGAVSTCPAQMSRKRKFSGFTDTRVETGPVKKAKRGRRD